MKTSRHKDALARERLLHLYATALDRGDLDTMLRLRTEAESDPILARQIQELEEQDAEAYPDLALADDAELVRALLARLLPSGRPQDDAEPAAPPPLTVAEVVGRMLAERTIPREDQAASLALRDEQAKVPPRLGRKDVLRFGRSLGAGLSDTFWQLFRETALLLGLGHSQQAGFAAARRAARKGAPAERDDARADVGSAAVPKKEEP